MDHETMRLECMKMAQAEGLTGKALDDRAHYLFMCARYGREEADRLMKPTPAASAPKANVVGRDGDLDKPFKDYLERDDG